MTKVAINGMGRIGRATFKILMEHETLELVAVNDIVPPDNIAYLLNYDTVYGRLNQPVRAEGDALVRNGFRVQMLAEKDPARLPWKELGIDVVFECTGIFTKTEDLKKHLEAGAQKVILSAPVKDEETPMVVHGVNDPKEGLRVISCASCTTNCITPVMEILGRRLGILKATMTTIHAYTSTQQIVDGPSRKWRRGRAGAMNLVPTSTGAANATTKALPQFSGKFNGVAVRCPVPVGSVADIVAVSERATDVQEVNRIFREEAESTRYRGILGVSEDEPVSSDIIQDPRAAVIDLAMTQVVDGDLIKVFAWYDNEWGYASQMVREAAHLAQLHNA